MYSGYKDSMKKTCEYCKHYDPFDEDDICDIGAEDYKKECPKFIYNEYWDCMRVSTNDYDMYI